jgi:hypothetical protein
MKILDFCFRRNDDQMKIEIEVALRSNQFQEPLALKALEDIV